MIESSSPTKRSILFNPLSLALCLSLLSGCALIDGLSGTEEPTSTERDASSDLDTDPGSDTSTDIPDISTDNPDTSTDNPDTSTDISPECAASVAKARVFGIGVYRTELTVTPHQYIEFSNGTGTGAGDKLTWSLFRQPTDSKSELENRFTAEPQLWLDQLGDYEIILNMNDLNDKQRCEPSTVKIRVAPREPIYIQLTWNTPTIPNPTPDTSPDLDLYYFHSNAQSWNDDTWAVYWSRKTQTWDSGKATLETENLDPSSPWGPVTEVVTHTNPADGSYRIGVHYAPTGDRGPTNATIRIYIQGQLKYSLPDQQMTKNQLWHIGDLHWPSGTLTKCDKLVSNQQDTDCPP